MTSAASEPTGMDLRNLLEDQEFLRRSRRVRTTHAELEAMRRLALVFAEGEEIVLQELADAAVACTGADSAGISLLEDQGNGALRFRWVAVAGSFAKYIEGTTPRFFSPCGTCLDRNQPQLYRVTKPYYDFLGIEADPVRDGILIPWQNEWFQGTFWAVSHASESAFDVNDYNLLSTVAEFASQAVCHHYHDQQLRAKEKLAASAAMANDLAHQINNPLQGLTNTLFLAQQGGAASARYIEQATEELAEVTELVRRLLCLNRDAVTAESDENAA